MASPTVSPYKYTLCFFFEDGSRRDFSGVPQNDAKGAVQKFKYDRYPILDFESREGRVILNLCERPPYMLISMQESYDNTNSTPLETKVE